MDSSHSARSCSRTPKQDPRSTTITINGPVVYMALGSNDFDVGKSISRALEGVGPENQGPPLPMVRVMDLPQSKSLEPSVIQVHW